MSETATLETLHKKRTELENHWSSQLQKQKNLEDNIKALEEKIQAQLQQKIKTEDEVLETLESKRGDLEKRLKELQEQRDKIQILDEPKIEAEEQVPEQSLEMNAAASDANQEHVEKHKEDKKRKWM